VPQTGLDFRDAAAADVEAGNLQLRREDGLGPSKHVATTAHLGTDVVLVEHHRHLRLGRHCGAISGFETDARSRVALAELDQLRGVRFGEHRAGLVAEIRHELEADCRHEQFAEYTASEFLDLLDRLAFAVDLGLERRSWEVHAGNAAIMSLHRPSGSASFGREEFVIVYASGLNELGFNRLQAFRLFIDLAITGDGFGDEVREVSVGHRSAGFQVFDSRAHPGSFAPVLARRGGLYTRIFQY